MTTYDPRTPDPRMISPWRAPPKRRRSRNREPAAEEHDDGVLVRPYLVTSGRTRPLQDGLRVETLIYAAPAALHAPLTFERRRIVELCQTPRSIAALAIALSVPLGVVRVLVADLVTDDYVLIHRSNHITVNMLERIIDRVREL